MGEDIQEGGKVEDRWRIRQQTKALLQIELVIAYGGACGRCKSTLGPFSIACVAHDGRRSAQPVRRGVAFYEVLRNAHWPTVGMLENRKHTIELRCPSCRRKGKILRKTRIPARMKRSTLAAMIERHEGLRLKPYRDSVGKLTIGFGRNLDDVGISEDEARFLLDLDITRVVSQLTAKIPCFGSLDTPRQHVLVDMGVNLGVEGLLHFSKMLDFLERRDFEGAATEMLISKWASQVGDRATELSKIMKEGE